MSENQECEEHDEYITDSFNKQNKKKSFCNCLDSKSTHPNLRKSERKSKIMSVTIRTEEYLRVRRIPELIHYLMTKILAQMPDSPAQYLENILDDCMLFRAGHGNSPVIYEEGHLRAVIKSFDPSDLGWLSMDQVKVIFSTLGLPFVDNRTKCEQNQINNITTDAILNMLQQCQEEELLKLFNVEAEND